MAKWIEIKMPVFENLQSTGARQPLAPEHWPQSLRARPDFTGVWLTPVLDPPATSTGTLSTGKLHAYLETERSHTKGAPLRYNRYDFARTIDGRVFQWSVPDRDVEYGHHREKRPPSFGSYRSTST